MRKAGGTALRSLIRQHNRPGTRYVEIEWVPLPSSVRAVAANFSRRVHLVTSFASPLARIVDQYLFEGGIGVCTSNQKGQRFRFGNRQSNRSCENGAQLADYMPFDEWLRASRMLLSQLRPRWDCLYSLSCSCCDPAREHWPLPRSDYAKMLKLLSDGPTQQHYLGRLYIPNYYTKALLGLPPGDVVTPSAHLAAARGVLRQFKACAVTERLGDGSHVDAVLANLSAREHGGARSKELGVTSGGGKGARGEVDHVVRVRLGQQVTARYAQTIAELRTENAVDLMLYEEVHERGGCGS